MSKTVKTESLFQAYIQAAFIAVTLRVSLAHAFAHYVKPELPADLPLMTKEEQSRWTQMQESVLGLEMLVPESV